MKINISYGAAGTQKQLNITEELRLRPFYDKRISHEVPADSLGPEWKGYVLKITGGSDKCGTAMMQGVLTTGRVSLLLGKKSTGVKIKRDGVRLRKTVHGCIVDPSLSVINAVIVKKGTQEIPGLTDTTVPRRLGPKRAGKIRSIFKLSADDDVRKYVIRRKALYSSAEKRAAAEAKGIEHRKAPKIQRLVTTKTKRRKKLLLKEKQDRSARSKKAADAYHKLVSTLRHQHKEQIELQHRKRRLSSVSVKRSTKSVVPQKAGKKTVVVPAKGKQTSSMQSKKVVTFQKTGTKTTSTSQASKPSAAKKIVGSKIVPSKAKAPGKPAASLQKKVSQPSKKPASKIVTKFQGSTKPAAQKSAASKASPASSKPKSTGKK